MYLLYQTNIYGWIVQFMLIEEYLHMSTFADFFCTTVRYDMNLRVRTVLETMWSSCRHSTWDSHRLRNFAARILSTTVLVCWKQQMRSAPSVASLYRGPGGGAGAPTVLLISNPALSAQHSGLEPCKQINLYI